MAQARSDGDALAGRDELVFAFDRGAHDAGVVEESLGVVFGPVVGETR